MRRAVRDPRRGRWADGPPDRAVPRRSHAAAPVALVVVVAGLVLGAYTILVPVLLGLLLVSVLGSFVSTRLNPLSVGFYLTTKPSWPAIGVVALSSMVLFATAWQYYLHGVAPVVPTNHPKFP